VGIRVPRLAVTLRWLTGLWIVGWTLYVTIWDNARLGSVEGMMTALAALLVPAILAFGLSWGLDRFFPAERGGGQGNAGRRVSE
jgi:hypothetical protein